jgi:circadian clock protein KaiC
LLRFHASRPTASGLETHLAIVASLVEEFQPKFVVIDPVSAFTTSSNEEPVKLMLIRMVDMFKSRGITSLFNALTAGNTLAESTAIGISSLMDVWFLLRNLELAGERTRGLYICKARGMAHSNQIREFLLTDDGVKLVDVLLDEDGQLLTGSARQLHQSRKESAAETRKTSEARRRAALENRRHVVEAKIAAMRAEFDEELRVLEFDLIQDDADRRAAEQSVADLASQRSDADRHQPMIQPRKP